MGEVNIRLTAFSYIYHTNTYIKNNAGQHFFTHSRPNLQNSVSIPGRALQNKIPSEAGKHMNPYRLS